MKKILFTLALIYSFSSVAQIKEYNSEKDLLVYQDGQTYNSTKAYYNSKYGKDELIFRMGNQMIYIKLSRVAEFGKLYEEGMNKALKWWDIAKENNVPKVEKEMDFKFMTDGGMLYDASTFKASKPTEGIFKVRIEFDKYIGDSNNYRYRAYQTDEYRVYSAFADVGLYSLNKAGELEMAKMLIEFCKNYETFVNEAIDKFNSKDDLFN